MRPAILLVAAILVFPAASNAQDGNAPRRVIIISCDGLRPDAIDTAPAPVLQGLVAAGSYQATCLDEMPAVTLPNHTSMLTGLSEARHGVWQNTTLPGRIDRTTVFDVAKAAGLRAGFFVGKEKLAYLCEEGSVDAWVVDGDLDALTAAVVEGIETADLDLIFVHFGATDSAGHGHGWMGPEYLEAVREVDAAIGQIVDAVERAGLSDQTAVVVSADHGGHSQTHGLDIPEDRFIPFIIHGPGVAAGRSLCEQTHIMDVAATALYFLGLPTDSAADGAVVTEALAESQQTPCTAPEVRFSGLCAPLPVLVLGLIVGHLLWRRAWPMRVTPELRHSRRFGRPGSP